MSATCTKTYQIVVDPAPVGGDYSWWKFNELSGNRVDSVRSIVMAATANGASTEGRTGGLINFAALATTNTPDGQVTFVTPSSADMAPGADGCTVCGWIALDGTGYPPGVGTYIQFLIIHQSTSEWLMLSGSTYPASQNTFDFGTFTDALAPIQFDGADWPTAGQLVFFAMVHDIAAGQARCYIGVPGTSLALAGTRGASGSAGASAYLALTVQATGPASLASIDITMSEWGFFPQVLSLAQIDYLFNSGIGRTSPITLP
jgi:hypothetical protein